MAKGKQLVNLKRDWFAPDGSLYQVRDNPHEFPADWGLPPTAVEDDVKSVGGALDDKGVEQPTQSATKAAAGAEAQNLDVGGKPRESGPLPAGTKKPN